MILMWFSRVTMKITVFWDVKLCNLVQAYQRLEKKAFPPFYTLKIEAARSSETTVNFHYSNHGVTS